MSDISDADFSAVGESADFSSEGLVSDTSSDVFETNNPSEGFDTVPDSVVSESDVPVESLFELDGTPITLDEARNGYLRQSDYTKKTQELAEMRSRLSEAEAITAALQQDPQGTLRALQDAFGIGVESGDDEYVDPDVRRISVLEQKIAAQESAASQAAIQNELNDLHDQFGEFDDSGLFAHVIKGGFPNLRAAYADLNFENLQAQLSTIQSQQAEQEKRVAAKRQAANVVHNGSSRSGATAPAQPEQFGSLRDAYLAAKKTLGVG